MTALSQERRQLEMATIEAGEREVIQRMTQMLVRAAFDAFKINDDGLDDDGNEVFDNRKRKRAAMDMRKSKRNAPVNIDFMARMIEVAKKADALKAQPKHNLNVGVVVQVKVPEYETVMLDEQHKER